jgi:hypothetical protein
MFLSLFIIFGICRSLFKKFIITFNLKKKLKFVVQTKVFSFRYIVFNVIYFLSRFLKFYDIFLIEKYKIFLKNIKIVQLDGRLYFVVTCLFEHFFLGFCYFIIFILNIFYNFLGLYENMLEKIIKRD